MAITATSYNPTYKYGDTNAIRALFLSGYAVNVGDMCFLTQPTRTVSDGATTISTATLTSATALFTVGDIGAAVVGTNIPANTTILSVQSSTSVTMSANATATGSAISVTITPTQGPSLVAAQYYPWTTNLATTQANFVQQFAGISGQAFDGTNTTAYGIQDGMLRCDTTGVFDLACASATFGAGDPVGPAQDVGNNLTGQTVIAVSALNQAIGRVAQPYNNATTVVRTIVKAARFNLTNAGAV